MEVCVLRNSGLWFHWPVSLSFWLLFMYIPCNYYYFYYANKKLNIVMTDTRVVYKIPDGYVYELPEIFSSAALAATSLAGIPQRQGILHRELLYQHALVSYQQSLYCLSEEMYNSSGIPEVMFRNARCDVEVVVPGKKGGKKIQKINLNNILRRMSYQRELDVVHPCFLNDFYIKEVIAPPFVYYTTTPKCFQCKKTRNLFYCSLCRKRQVQTPHVYCSKKCQAQHWDSHHCAFHINPISEQQVYVHTASDELKRVEMQNNEFSLANASDNYSGYDSNSILNEGPAYKGMTYEQYVFIFIVFYGTFWYVLKLHADDEQDL